VPENTEPEYFFCTLSKLLISRHGKLGHACSGHPFDNVTRCQIMSDVDTSLVFHSETHQAAIFIEVARRRSRSLHNAQALVIFSDYLLHSKNDYTRLEHESTRPQLFPARLSPQPSGGSCGHCDNRSHEVNF
jgi:hypothetical protein